MSLLALGLILTAAIVHASWNLLAKRAGGGAAFVWLFGVLAAGIYAPLALGVILLQRPSIGPLQLGFVLGSAVLQTSYYLVLQRGYRVGDLSLVYPLARGTGPMLSTAAAVVFFGERPSAIALAGALLIGVSVFTLAGSSGALASSSARAGVVFGLLTGTIIASYTLWDKQAVSVLLIPPLLMDWSTNVTRSLLVAPYAARNWGEVKREWKLHRRYAIGIAVLNPLSYILVLTAMVFTPVSYVAPAREISILVGTVMGAKLLSEGNSRRRVLAAGGMVAGVIALALG